MKRNIVLLVLGIVLLVGALGWFVFCEDEEFSGDITANDYCERDEDCVVENMDYSMCSCDLKAVNKEYALVVGKEYADYFETHDDLCDGGCLVMPASCVSNVCVIDN